MNGTVKLSKVEVKGLFGLFDHIVPLRNEERVTILHGPNGVGKTVILRMISAIFRGRYEYLVDTNFQQFLVELSDGRAISISRNRGNEVAEGARWALLISKDGSEESFTWFRDRTDLMRMAEYIDREVPYITRFAEEVWSDDRTGETYGLSQLVEVFRDALPEKLRTTVREPAWLEDFRSSISVHLVETQRLLMASLPQEINRFRVRHASRIGFGSTVKSYSNDLKNRVAAALTAYAEHSQALDRSFPQRMLGGAKTETLETGDLKARMNQLEQQRNQLKAIGLIEEDASYPFDIDTLDSASPTQKAVMSLYVEDTENKLGVLSELKQKVDLLLGNINRKFRPNKQLRADRTTGLLVRDKRNLRIDLDSLSSGEQHELVLIYGLLFQVQPHSLVLIDEPELSLHLTWQKAFLKELFAIIEASDFDVLLATHSPFVVGERIDLMVSLALGDEEEETPSISESKIGV